MNRQVAAIALCAAMLMISECAVQGHPFERASAPPDNAVIYVYRPYHYGSSLLRPAVTCGEDSARIGPGGYHAFIVPSGSQQILCSVEGSESSDQVEIDAHTRVYYIREEFVWGVLSGHPHLNPVDTDQAQTEIQHCCVQEP
ncbi:MAG TPA: hypothetical protein VL393_08700 [Candidatus Binataceae bacterium]|jgi:hypothetical protein|nr:hypothetical protein [Candidatus Binataceae bacterium]